MSDAPFPGFEPPEANFTPVPNAFFDCVLGHYPLRVVTVVGILIRSTLGWQDKVTGEKRLERELPLRAFVRPELSENSARQGLREAIAAGLVIETSPHTNRDGARYALRWADENMLLDRIARQRRAAGDARAFGDPAEARERAARRLAAGGAKSGPPKSGPPKSGGPTSSPLLKKRSAEKKPFLNGLKKPLNVGAAGGEKPDQSTNPRPAGTTPNAVGERDAYSTLVTDGVRQVLALTGDTRSTARFVQLRQVCLEHNATSAWTIALRSTERRKRQPGLTKPGAWFNSVCVRELEKRGIHVPKKADEGEQAEVRALLAAQFGGTEC